MDNRMPGVYAAVVLGNFFWGISNIWTRIALSVADPEVLLTFRFLTAFAGLSISHAGKKGAVQHS